MACAPSRKQRRSGPDPDAVQVHVGWTRMNAMGALALAGGIGDGGAKMHGESLSMRRRRRGALLASFAGSGTPTNRWQQAMSCPGVR